MNNLDGIAIKKKLQKMKHKEKKNTEKEKRSLREESNMCTAGLTVAYIDFELSLTVLLFQIQNISGSDPPERNRFIPESQRGVMGTR